MDTRFHIYVIRLDDEALLIARFRNRNPSYIVGKPGYYIGSSIHEPQVRFEQHKAGKRASRIVTKYGKYVVKKKCFIIENANRDQVEEAEREYAEELRGHGYGVWQG